MNYIDLLFNHSSNDLAIQQDSQVLTYEELNSRIFNMEIYLRSVGIDKNDHVALKVSDRLQYIVIFLALWRVDATIIPIDSQVNVQTLTDMMDDADITFFITEPHDRTSKKYIEICSKLEEVSIKELDIAGLQLVSWADTKPEDHRSWIELMGLPRDQGYMMLYTSGTSGKVKGVLLKKASLINNIKKVIAYTELTSRDSLLLTLPLTYSLALSQMLAHLIVGGKVILADQAKSSVEILQQIKLHQVTNYASTPYFYENITKTIHFINKEFLQNKVKFFMNAGGYISKYTIEHFIKLFPNAAFYNNYGQTEASSRLCYNKITDPDCDTDHVGIPISGVSIRIFDDSGNLLEENSIGEIGFISEDMMIGYYKQSVLNRERYFLTGDLGYINAEGKLVIVGRQDSMIKINGRKVYKNAIEDQLQALSFIQAAKFKKEVHPSLGEYFVAYVILKAGVLEDKAISDIYAFCKKHFNKYIIPKKIIICNEFALTSNQKVKIQ